MGSQERIFLDEATSIAERYVREAIWHEDECTWIQRNLQEPNDPLARGPTAETMDASIYSGAAGVAITLGELARVTKDERHARTAKGAMRFALRLVRRSIDARPAGAWRGRILAGFYSGGLGVAWAGLELSRILRDPDLGEEADVLRRAYLDHRPVPPFPNKDVLGGSAASILACLDWYRRGVPGALDYANTLAQDLLASAEWRDGTVGWPSPTKDGRGAPLTGFSHGSTGYALAMVLMYEATGNGSYMETAKASLAYERRHYLPAKKNWRDLRDVEGVARPLDATMTAWCHGAPGVGLGRFAMRDLLDDPRVDAELDVARETTRSALDMVEAIPDWNTSYCHGVVGNLDCYVQMLEESDRREGWSIAARLMSRRIAAFGHLAKERWSHAFLEWPTGRPGYTDLSLFKGLAGVAHFLLRLHSRGQVPTVLIPACSAANPSP